MEEAFDKSGSIDKARLKALATRSDAKGLAQLASHGAVLTGTGVLVWSAGTMLWLVPALMLHGLVLTFLFAPLHETIHRTAFAKRGLNDAVARVCGLVLLLPPDFFRAFHFAHHRYTQDPARDPEFGRPKPETLRDYLIVLSGWPYWQDRVLTLFRHSRGRVTEAFIAPAQRPVVIREARMVLGVYAGIAVVSIAAASPAALLYWVVPALLGQPALRAYLLAEHMGCPLVPDMLRNTRTTKSNALVRWLAWNMPYHVEHHAYPALPFHALRAAHAEIKDRIVFLAPGYLAVHRGFIAGFQARRPAPA